MSDEVGDVGEVVGVGMVGLYVDVVGVEYFDGVVFVGEVDCVVGVF